MGQAARVLDGETFWTIRPLERRDTFTLDLGRRRKAAVYFTSAQGVASFKAADLVDRRWHVVEMSAEAFIVWLRQQLRGGTKYIFRDPSNLFCLGRQMEIAELLGEKTPAAAPIGHLPTSLHESLPHAIARTTMAG